MTQRYTFAWRMENKQKYIYVLYIHISIFFFNLLPKHRPRMSHPEIIMCIVRTSKIDHDLSTTTCLPLAIFVFIPWNEMINISIVDSNRFAYILRDFRNVMNKKTNGKFLYWRWIEMHQRVQSTCNFHAEHDGIRCASCVMWMRFQQQRKIIQPFLSRLLWWLHISTHACMCTWKRAQSIQLKKKNKNKISS